MSYFCLPKHLTKSNKLLTNAASSRASLSSSSFICLSLFSSALIASSASFSGASAPSFKTNLASRSIFAFSSSPFFVPNSASLCFFRSLPPIQSISKYTYIICCERGGMGLEENIIILVSLTSFVTFTFNHFFSQLCTFLNNFS